MEKIKVKFIGDYRTHVSYDKLGEFLINNNNTFYVENVDDNEYYLSYENENWYFERSELELINEIPLLENNMQNHLKDLISKMSDRISCIAYITGYSKYNPDVEKDDLIYILQYILENK